MDKTTIEIQRLINAVVCSRGCSVSEVTVGEVSVMRLNSTVRLGHTFIWFVIRETRKQSVGKLIYVLLCGQITTLTDGLIARMLTSYPF